MFILGVQHNNLWNAHHVSRRWRVSPHTVTMYFLVRRTFKLYSLSSFQICDTVLLTTFVLFDPPHPFGPLCMLYAIDTFDMCCWGVFDKTTVICAGQDVSRGKCVWKLLGPMPERQSPVRQWLCVLFLTHFSFSGSLLHSFCTHGRHLVCYDCAVVK